MFWKKKGSVVSMLAGKILRHGAPAPWRPVQAAGNLEAISEHIASHIGRVETVFHEIASDAVHIDVHIVLPTERFPFIRLVTSGMSDLPMSTPAGADVPQFAELFVTLPDDWHLDAESFKNENWYWPVRLLKTLARLPHWHNTWLGWGHSVPNGDPAQAYAENTRLCGAIVLPSVTAPEEFHTLVSDEKKIAFYSVVPVYEEEMNLKLRLGTQALLDKFDRHKITDIVDPCRVNVVTKN